MAPRGYRASSATCTSQSTAARSARIDGSTLASVTTRLTSARSQIFATSTSPSFEPSATTTAKRLVADIKAIDTTRPIVIGSDKYGSVPSTGSGADLILGQLDGLGLNYNTAASVDALHAKYPNTFLFESESSSETSSRGAYQDPDQLNTGENYTPGKQATSSYDNNLASWTMSGEYGLKKDRDRKYFLGEFLWSGIDYIGEPTPTTSSP